MVIKFPLVNVALAFVVLMLMMALAYNIYRVIRDIFPKQSHGHLYRLVMAFLISIGLNLILVVVDFSIDPRRAELSRIERWAVRLLTPAEALTMGLVPGHGGAQILALILFSVLVYAITAWVVLSLHAWWRYRA